VSNRVLAIRRGPDGPERVEARIGNLAELIADPDVVVWVDLDSQGPESERVLREIFELHPLLIEDAFADATTPKAEDFGDYLYVIVHGLSDDDASDGEVQTADLDLFIGRDFLITHYRLPFKAIEQAWRRVETDGHLLAKGPAFVSHAIIDTLVDEFLPLMESLDAEVDRIEEKILADSSPQLLERIFRMKHSLQRIRRVGLHQKALLLAIAEGKYELVPEEVRPFFRDVYDHMVRVVDLNEVYRELMGTSLDAYLGVQSHKLNEVMRVLTIFSTVMLPLTFITGLYGMNFDELPYMHQDWGFAGAVFVMVSVALTMVLFFKRRNWL